MVSTTVPTVYGAIRLTDRSDIPNTIGITGTPTIDPTVRILRLRAPNLVLLESHYILSSASGLLQHQAVLY
jgi:hypothetical protein